MPRHRPEVAVVIFFKICPVLLNAPAAILLAASWGLNPLRRPSSHRQLFLHPYGLFKDVEQTYHDGATCQTASGQGNLGPLVSFSGNWH